MKLLLGCRKSIPFHGFYLPFIFHRLCFVGQIPTIGTWEVKAIASTKEAKIIFEVFQHYYN